MDLQVKRLSLDLGFEDKVPELPFASATLRGGFGYALRKVSCAFKTRECEGCLAHGQCVYSYVFDTVPDPRGDFMSRYNRAPHPFVLYCHERTDSATLRAGLVLVGRAILFLPYFVLALQELGREGLGRYRNRFSIKSITETDTGAELLEQAGGLRRTGNPEIFPLEARANGNGRPDVTFRLLSPLRLKYNGGILRTPDFRAVAGSLLRRLSSLSNFHGQGKPELDYPRLAALADEAKVTEDGTEWEEHDRYSTRQKEWMSLGGITGRFRVQGVPGEFLGLLRVGETVGLGKACTFGFGRYRMEKD